MLCLRLPGSGRRQTLFAPLREEHRGLVWHILLLSEHVLLLPQLRDRTFRIGLDGWFLGNATILLDPAVQGREADPKIRRQSFTRQPAGQSYPHCFGVEFLGRS